MQEARLTFSLLCEELFFNRMVNVMQVLLMEDGAVVLLACILERLLRLIGGRHGDQRVLFAAARTVHDRSLLRESTRLISDGLCVIVAFLCFGRLFSDINLLSFSISAV